MAQPSKAQALLGTLTPLSLSLIGTTLLVLLTAFALVRTSLNEFRAGAAFRKVLLAYGAGSSEMAAQGLPAAIEAKPARYAHPRLLGALLKVRGGDFAGAAEAYQGVLDEQATLLLPREQAVCFNGLGVAKMMQARAGPGKAALAEARELFQKAAEAWPELPESHLNLAALDLLAGKTEEARRRLPAASGTESLPPGADAVRNLALLKMVLAEEQGSWDQAAAEARRLAGYRPAGIEDRILLARALARRQRAQPAPDRPQLAPAESERLLSAIPHDERARARDRAEIRAGIAFWRMEAYWTAHERNATVDPEAWSRARSLIQEGLNQASRLAPSEPSVDDLRWVQWSRDLAWRHSPLSQSEASGAVEPEFKSLLARKDLPEPRRALMENNAGFLKAFLGRLDEALGHLERATALAPEHPVLVRNRAVLLDRKGDAAGALAWYETALRIQPGQADVEARMASLRPPQASGGLSP